MVQSYLSLALTLYRFLAQLRDQARLKFPRVIYDTPCTHRGRGLEIRRRENECLMTMANRRA